jgi:putative intracellular protease/amidase
MIAAARHDVGKRHFWPDAASRGTNLVHSRRGEPPEPLVEDMLVKSGGHYTKQPNWQAHVVTDGPLICGQNPASSEPAAKMVLELIRSRP